jgi:hypothetical protein
MSDNAIDISVPMGSAVLAVEPGTITRVGGSWGGGASRFDGLTAYLNNEVFYTHMKGRAVKAGQKVHSGDIIGESGAANGVPHLHIGFKPPLKPPGFAKGGIFGLAAGGLNKRKRKGSGWAPPQGSLAPVLWPKEHLTPEEKKRQRIEDARKHGSSTAGGMMKGGIFGRLAGGVRHFDRGGINAKAASASSVPANVRVAIDAARKAGFKGTDLVNMVAIAGRESTYSRGSTTRSRRMTRGACGRSTFARRRTRSTRTGS